MDKIPRTALYIRVSTAEQAIYGKSLQAQKECLQKYAEDHRMEVVGIYADEGQTARKELKKRKAIHTLLADVRAGRIDHILFWKMDRWFRNVSDFYKVQDVLDARHVTWTAVAEPNITLDTRDGRLNLNIMLSIGQNEVDTTSERIRFTVDNMIQNGRIVWGQANLGLGFTIENGKIIKDPATEHMVTEFYDYFRRHQKKRDTVLHMQKTFGIDFSYSMLRTLLTSELYIGKYRNNTAYCPAYLTPEEWTDIRRISERNIKSARSGRIYLFSGLLRCPGCGQRLTGNGCRSVVNRTTGEKRTYCYYRCNRALTDNLCTYRHKLSQAALETGLLDLLAPEFGRFSTRCHVRAKKTAGTKKRPAGAVRQEIARLNFLFQKDRIPLSYYETEYRRLETELTSLERADPEPPADFSPVMRILSSDFRTLYDALSQENRQAFWHGILSEITLDPDGQIRSVQFL